MSFRSWFMSPVPSTVPGTQRVLNRYLLTEPLGSGQVSKPVSSLHRGCVHSCHSQPSPLGLSFPPLPSPDSRTHPSRLRASPSALSITLPSQCICTSTSSASKHKLESVHSLHLVFPIIASSLFPSEPLSQFVIVFIYVFVYSYVSYIKM